MSKNNENKLVPKLRFPEFENSGEWEVKSLDEIAEFLKGKGISKSDVDKNGKLPCIRYGELYTHYKEVIKEIKSFTNLSEDDLVLSEKDDVIIPSSGETKDDIATASCVKIKGVALGGDLNILRSKLDGEFLAYYLSNGVKKSISKIAQGDAVVHLYSTQLKKISIKVPSKKTEQQKIASCLSSLDEVITAESQKLELLKQHKKGLLQNLFPQEGETVPKLRFPEFEDVWSPEQLSNLLDYERPDNYIVKDTNYISEGTPVLTANKSFILGYTQETFGVCNDIPAIIFDDFTVDKKFVDFPFKVKSSAIKILRPKGKDDLKFIFELMSLIRFEAKEHKRYYISAYQNLSVPIPKPKEQQKIASCLSSLDDLISAQSQKIETLKRHKKGLLQGLFPTIDDLSENK